MTQPTTTTLSARQRETIIAMDKAILSGLRHWLLILNVFMGLYVTIPWFAPVLMQTGHTRAARVVYFLYSTQCHQLPQRSFFLFGPKLTYSLAENRAAWRDTNNPFILRQFVGNPQMGWKVAWSDRMVSMYTSIFFAGLLFWPLRRHLRPAPLWVFALLILPMIIDGGTHLISDSAGLGNGFRDSNLWLAALTGNTLPDWFYAGDALGSFNSWMRLITGALFGIGVVWLAYPYMEQFVRETGDELEAKLRRAGVIA